MATTIQTSPNYFRNYDGSTGPDHAGPCVVCGKGVTPRQARYLMVDLATYDAVTPEEAKTRPESGGHPIGADCLRRHPELKPYIV